MANDSDLGDSAPSQDTRVSVPKAVSLNEEAASLTAIKMDSATEMQPSMQTETDTYEKATRVLNIPELRELILLHLDMKTLLFCQRVNTQWRDVIMASKSLLKKLFFIPLDLFEEGRSLNMVEDDDIVVISIQDPRTPNYLTLLSPLFLVSENLEEKPNYAYFYLPQNIVRATTSIKRGTGSGERMLLCQPAQDSVSLDIPTYTISDSRTAWWGAVLDESHFNHTLHTTLRGLCARFSSPGEAKLGSVIDSIEQEVFGDCLIWARAAVMIVKWATRYTWMLEKIAEREKSG